MKLLILSLTAVVLCVAGCASPHFQQRQSGKVTLYLREPGAGRVEFASSLDAYERHRADRINGSLWAVTVAADAEFRYFYIVDGRVVVPECEFFEKDDFGSRNCLFIPQD